MNRLELLIVQSMEEASEYIKECSKALRFGLDDVHPKYGNSNRERMRAEFVDFISVTDMIAAEGVLPIIIDGVNPSSDLWFEIMAKHKKVERYLDISKTLGRLT